LRRDGVVLAWGENFQNQMEPPPSATNVTAIATMGILGGYVNYALRMDGSVVCWGYTPPSFIPPASATNIVALYAGDAHMLALKADGTVIGWGFNDFGATDIPPSITGRNVTVSGSVDVNVPGLYTLTYNATNAFGETATATRTVEVAIPVQPAVTNLAATGVSNSVATLNGFVDPKGEPAQVWFEWGLGDIYPYATPSVTVSVAGPVSAALGGLTPGRNYHSRLVASNRLGIVQRSWEQRFQSPRVVPVGPDPLVVIAGTAWTDPGTKVRMAPSRMAKGYGVGHAIRADGTVLSWGPFLRTNLLVGLTNVAFLDGGGGPALPFTLLQTDGTVMRGDLSPSEIEADAVAFDNGSDLLVLKKDGSLVSRDFVGMVQTNVPTEATSIVAMSQIAGASFAVRGDGRLIAWGYGINGETNVPASATNIVGIASSYFHTLALRGDGKVVAWGKNDYGQCNVPSFASKIVKVSAYNDYSMALGLDGTVAVWGYGQSGFTNVPAGLSNVVAILAADRCMAMTADGQIVEWGGEPWFLIDPPAGLDETALNTTVSGDFNPNVPGDYVLAYTAVSTAGAVGTATRRVTVIPAGTVNRPKLSAPVMLANGSFQFGFTNQNGPTVSLLTSTNAALPLAQWTVLDAFEEVSPGLFRVNDVQATNHPQRFYLLRSP
jgi:hypothetical protein